MYWNRPLLKANAKKVLSTSYWNVFIVCFISGLLGNIGTGANAFTNFSAGFNNGMSGVDEVVGEEGAGLFLSIFGTSFLVAILLGIFVGAPLAVGANRFMMENRGGNPPISSMFSVFRDSKQYWNVVKVMFFLGLELSLWSLLCFIPGIYKAYQYFYVPYLLAENPYMSYSRAKQLSRAMTNNEKMEIFVLELSFFGWVFLGTMLCGIGTLFVSPYISATFAELYAAARAKAFNLGVTDSTELADFTHYIDPMNGSTGTPYNSL